MAQSRRKEANAHFKTMDLLYKKLLGNKKRSNAHTNFLKRAKPLWIQTEGLIAHLNDNLLEAVMIYERAELAYLHANEANSAHFFTLYSSLALTWNGLGNYTKSLAVTLKSLQLAEKRGLKKQEIVALINLGVWYSEQNKADMSITYYKKVLEKATLINFGRAVSAALNNLSVIYADKKKYDSSLMYCRQAEALKLKLADSASLYLVYVNMSRNYRGKNLVDSATFCTEKVRQLYEVLGMPNIQNAYLQSRMEICLLKKDYKEGLRTLYAYRKNHEQTNTADLGFRQDILSYELALYKGLNNYKAALEAHEALQALKDSINANSKEGDHAKLEMQYEFDKKKQEELIKQKEQELLRQQEAQKQRWTTIAIVTVLVLVTAFALYIFRKQRQMKMANTKILIQNSELQQQREEILIINEQLSSQKSDLEKASGAIELKNIEITKGIESAQSVQTATLPSERSIKKYFADLFIFYSPKDIVSGDIYWFGLKNNKKVLAVIDCTGHGVHGAFITLIAYNLMNKIVLSKDITEPSQILELLNLEFIKNLRQEENNNNDGMDIGVCAFEAHASHFQFSGACTHVIEVRNGILVETKGVHKHLGGNLKNTKNKQFETHLLQVNPSSTYYLCTDGYADQHNGSTNARFTRTKFKEMLSDISVLSMQEQQAVLQKTLLEWQGAAKQTDDVTIVGFRL